MFVGVALALAMATWPSLAQEGGAESPSVQLEFPDASTTLADLDSVREWANSSLHRKLELEPTDRLDVSGEPRSVGTTRIYTIRQTVGDLPVVERESQLVVSSDHKPSHLLGQHEPFPDPPSAEPSLDSAQALTSVGGSRDSLSSSRLVFLPVGGELRQTYELEGGFESSQSPLERVFVDAHNGDVLKRLPLIHPAMDRRVYDFPPGCEAAGIRSTATGVVSAILIQRALIMSLAKNETSSAAVRAPIEEMFPILGRLYDFFQATLQLDSYDDNGAPLQVLMGVRFGENSQFPQCVGRVFNGFWNDFFKLAVFTDEIVPFPEMIGHEFGHAMIDSGSMLIYEGESGALNESISDAIGIAFRAWKSNRGQFVESQETEFWRLGSPSGPVRDMQNPRRIDNLPNITVTTCTLATTQEAFTSIHQS